MVFDPDGRILMVKSRLRGTWEWPAGRSDGHESPLETAHRETREETGLDIEGLRFLGVNFQPGLTKNGRLNFTFCAEISQSVADTVSPQAIEISDYRWMTVAEAREKIAPKLKSRFYHLLDAYAEGNSLYLESGETI